MKIFSIFLLFECCALQEIMFHALYPLSLQQKGVYHVVGVPCTINVLLSGTAEPLIYMSRHSVLLIVGLGKTYLDKVLQQFENFYTGSSNICIFEDNIFDKSPRIHS